MMHPAADIRTLLQPGKRVHLAGIGGVSMCALAEVLQGMGLVVQGSDMTDSDTVRHLRSLGMEVAIGHSAENLKNCDAVIRTAAIHDDNPEIAGAIARGIPVYERAQAWGGIMRSYRNALCISGTHGKTTTTSMATHIFMAAQKDPTVMIGGTLPLLHGGYRVGQGDTIILESCEYCNSFLNFFPTVAVILNVHADHLDFFKDLADIEHSFHDFAALVPERGFIIANADDEGAREAVKGLTHPVFTFSVKDRSADCYADNVSFFDGFGDFDIIVCGHHYAHVSLRVPGAHNVSNALAAAAAMAADSGANLLIYVVDHGTLRYLILSICGVLGMIAFLVAAVSHFTGRNTFRKAPVLALLLPLWVCVRAVVLTFIEYTNVTTISSNMLSVLSVLGMLMFLFSLSKLFTGIETPKTGKRTVYGINLTHHLQQEKKSGKRKIARCTILKLEDGGQAKPCKLGNLFLGESRIQMTQIHPFLYSRT